MKTYLSIIIVSWNVRELLRKCLKSIGSSFEIFVVDNASTDGSAAMVSQEFPQVKLIKNQKNFGFAKASNQAIKQAQGKYILLLNPDTEILDQALEKMVRFMETHPDADVAGGQILNPDQTIQPSVRRFPTLYSSLIQLFKIHHLISPRKILKKYLCIDFDYTKTQVVNQVMGAFLIFKKELGLLNEDYYLWLEDVDLCRRAKKVYYTPEAQIIHYGGQSFKQQTTLKKQYNFYRSLLTYWRQERIRNFGFDFCGQYFKWTFLILLFVELFSWIAYSHLYLNYFLLASLTFLAFILSLWRLEYGIYIALAELVSNSMGRLFSYGVVSLRLTIFLAVFGAWLVWIIREKKIIFFQFKLAKYYLILFAFFALGLLTGYLHHNSLKNIFFDWNGYLYFGMIFPLTQAIRTKEQIHKIWQIIFAAFVLMFLKTFFILYAFSHTSILLYYLDGLYHWIRDTRVGEITRFDNGFVRVFFQGHFYAMIVGLFSFSLLVFRKFNFSLLLKALMALFLIFVSYSRSFWLGITLISLLFFLYLWKKLKFKKTLLLGLSLLGSLIFVIGLTWGIVNLPPGGAYVKAGTLLTERTEDITEEAAGKSRLALLKPLFKASLKYPIWGSGFGTTVTYQSADPRVQGSYTTYAFEWGYLDLWLKLGGLGLIAYSYLLFVLLRTGWQKRDNPLIFGSFFGLLALVILNAFTPYLNHPLGIGWLLLTSLIFEKYAQ